MLIVKINIGIESKVLNEKETDYLKTTPNKELQKNIEIYFQGLLEQMLPSMYYGERKLKCEIELS